MSFASRVLAWMARLPPARTYDVGVERDLAVPMPDGASLLADRHFPRGTQNAPVVLIRTPYGRRGFGVFGRIFAERGYQAVIQSLRGTDGSSGQFRFADERSDGLATLEWLSRQGWACDRVGMYGASYLGFAQWAVGAQAPASLRALAIQIATSNRRESVYAGAALQLDFALTLANTLAAPATSPLRTLLRRLRERRLLAPAFAHLPLGEADVRAVGRPVGFYRDWLAHEGSPDPYWASMDHSGEMDRVEAPVSLVGGWYDCYLARQLADYAALRRAGRNPRITIGPWAHTDLGLLAEGLRDSLAWFDVQLRDDRSRLRELPVRVFVMGSRRWLDLPDWPPPGQQTPWYLQPEGGLATTPPAVSPPDRYDYDPTDPTPSVGGAVIGRHAGAHDNRALESRPDLRVYTSAALGRDLELVGNVTASIHFRSSLAHTDLFVRLCDVEPGGRSTNVCDGFVRLTPGAMPANAEGIACVRVELSPTACCFRRGHRLRVQVASGAHPRFARNLGTGEPAATATRLQVAHQEVFHDPAHASALVLPARS